MILPDEADLVQKARYRSVTNRTHPHGTSHDQPLSRTR
jgi:hypothetical protein